MDWAGLFGLFGMTGVGIFLVIMGLLSKRLGEVTKATPYYRGFFLASAFVVVGVIARLYHISIGVAVIDDLHHNIGWVMLYNGAPALGITLGLFVGWRYWSWLLAERN